MSKKLTDAQKRKVMACALNEAAFLIGDDHRDPFKDRELPELPEDAYDAADKFFFVCIERIAAALRNPRVIHEIEAVSR